MQNSEPPVPLDPFRKFNGPPVPIDVMLKTIMTVARGNFKLLEDPAGRLHGCFTRTRLFASDECVYVSDAIEDAYSRLRQRVKMEIGILELRKSQRSDTIP